MLTSKSDHRVPAENVTYGAKPAWNQPKHSNQRDAALCPTFQLDTHTHARCSFFSHTYIDTVYMNRKSARSAQGAVPRTLTCWSEEHDASRFPKKSKARSWM